MAINISVQYVCMYGHHIFNVDERKGGLNPSRDKNLRHVPQWEGCLAFLLL